MSDKLPQRKNLSHAIPSWVADSETYFITINCRHRRIDQLTTPEVAPIILDSAKFHNDRNNWFCRLLVLMPDHLHALVAFPQGAEMKKFISAWKGYLAKKCGIKWQRDFFDHRIRGWESLDAKADYIRMNPVRGGLVEQYMDWPWALDYYQNKL